MKNLITLTVAATMLLGLVCSAWAEDPETFLQPNEAEAGIETISKARPKGRAFSLQKINRIAKQTAVFYNE